MVIDFILIVLLILPIIYGIKKGFVYTLIHTVGWLGAFTVAYFITPMAKGILKSTPLHQWFYESVKGKLDASISQIDALISASPDIISGNLRNNSGNIIDGIASNFSDAFFTILTFILCMIALKVIFFILLRLFSKEYSDGVTGVCDGLFGGLFGLLKGGVLVLIFLTLLVPVSFALPDSASLAIQNQLDSSIFSKTLYDQNFLLVILQAFFK